MTALATTFATGHVGLNVADLDRSVDFYAGIFGWDGQGPRRRLRVPRRRRRGWSSRCGSRATARSPPTSPACTTSRSRSTRSRTSRPPRRASASAGLQALPRRHRPPRRGRVQRRDLLRGPRRDPAGDLHRRRRRRAQPRRPATPRPAASSRPMPFHAGELAVQTRAGVADRAAGLLGMFTAEVPDVAPSRSSTTQPWIVLGAADARRPHVGERALRLARGSSRRRAVDGPHRRAAAAPATRSPARSTARSAGSRSSPARAAACGSTAGVDRGRRRDDRARAGLLELPEVHRDAPRRRRRAGARRCATPATALDAPRSELLARADTAFVATRAPDAGVDASHRGGNPGFLRVVDEHTLVLPDYTGNSMFNTLGNIALDPATGLTRRRPRDGHDALPVRPRGDPLGRRRLPERAARRPAHRRRYGPPGPRRAAALGARAPGAQPADHADERPSRILGLPPGR